MWTYRKTLKISCVDRVINIEALRIGKEKEVEMTIKERKLEYFEHVMAGEK